MRIMYWNCTAPDATGQLASQKLGEIAERITALRPDILCLDEVSSRIDSIDKANAWMAALHAEYACAGVIVNEGTHMNTTVFLHSGVAQRINVEQGLPAESFSGDKTKRDLLRAQFTDAKTARVVSIWFLHANASATGGTAAVGAAARYVGARNNDVLIGDFNNADPSANGAAVTPPLLLKNGGKEAYGYSQWARADTGTAEHKIGTARYVQPHGVIDYAVSKAGMPTVLVTPVDALAGLSTTLNQGVPRLQIDFDHFPIVYDITCR